MVKSRVVETNNGIQGDFNVKIYDSMMRRLRDKGWMETVQIVNFGINHGLVLEIGPGPGYLGLEWLKITDKTDLKGLDISPDMIKIAEKNAAEYGLKDRVEYVKSDARKIPFEDNTFDSVFTNGSLHEWEEAVNIFNEIYRVLKPGGRYFISDLRRDMNPLMKWLMKLFTKPVEIRPGLISSINASYTEEEISKILLKTWLNRSKIKKTVMGLEIRGVKE